MDRRFFLGAGAAFLSMGFAAPEAVAGSSISHMLGSTQVVLNLYASRAGKVTYFAPHSNETTGYAAARAAVKSQGGRFFWLTYGGGRNIAFRLGGKKFAVDPNRMFSDRGAEASIKGLSGYKKGDKLPEGVLREVRKLAEAVTKVIFSKTSLIVGIHNNTNGGNLSAVGYQSNHAEAQAVYVNPEHDADDFFFVTSRTIFIGLKKLGYNVVLQASPIADDGSLSVRCQRSGLPYVNVEAQAGHASQQQKMLQALLSI